MKPEDISLIKWNNLCGLCQFDLQIPFYCDTSPFLKSDYYNLCVCVCLGFFHIVSWLLVFWCDWSQNYSVSVACNFNQD